MTLFAEVLVVSQITLLGLFHINVPHHISLDVHTYVIVVDMAYV
ncbi:hypothetical protein ACFLY2_02185 [Patescibacteria group bacterium]